MDLRDQLSCGRQSISACTVGRRYGSAFPVTKKRFLTLAALFAISTAMAMTVAGQEPYVRPKTVEEMIAYARQKAGVPDDFKPIRLSLSKSLFGSDDLLRGRLSVAFSGREKTRKLVTISIDLENGQVTSRRESSSGREE